MKGVLNKQVAQASAAATRSQPPEPQGLLAPGVVLGYGLSPLPARCAADKERLRLMNHCRLVPSKIPPGEIKKHSKWRSLRSNWLAAGCSGRPNGAYMNRTEPALGRRRCAGDGAPKARCALAASAQCLHAWMFCSI